MQRQVNLSIKKAIRRFILKNKIDYYDKLQIGEKLSLSLLIGGFCGFVMLVLFVKTTVYARLDRLENEQLNHHASQLQSYLDDVKTVVKDKSIDWSIWDETYKYATEFGEVFADKNYSFEPINDFGLSGIGVANLENNRITTYVYDKETQKLNQDKTNELKELMLSEKMKSQIRKTPNFQGFIRIKNELYSFSAAQILTSKKKGPVHGYMVVIEKITAEDIQNSLHFPTTIDLMRQKENFKFHYTPDIVYTSVAIKGIDNLTIGRLTTSYPRSLNSVKMSLWWTIALGTSLLMIAGVLFLYSKIQSIVIFPMDKIVNHLREISLDGEMRKIGIKDRNDEIGALANAFDSMIGRLNTLQSELERESYQLGKVQNQIDLMHNVKNTLSPFRVITSKIVDKIEVMQPNVYRAISELKNNNIDETRREKLFQYLESYLNASDDKTEEAKHLIRKAQENLDMIVQAISNGQNKSANTNFGESCNISNVVDNALSIARHNEIPMSINFDKDAQYFVKANRIIMGQLFDNLITNAVEAIATSHNDNGLIDIKISPVNDENGDMVEISIKDNGDGIEKYDLDNLFKRGFSTRDFKSGGLGLHWCANTVNSLGGKIKLSSQGKNQGAEVKIILPSANAA